MSRARLAFLCVVMSVAWAAAVAGAHEARPPARPRDATLTTTPRLPAIRPAPDFALVDATGEPVRLADLRGRVVLLSFVYTACPDACPLLTAQVGRLQRRLARDREAGGRTRLLTVTVDPARDSAAALAVYAARFGADPRIWSFLRAEPAALGPVLAAYDEWTRPAPDGAIDHPARLFLIDPAGRIREIYALGFFDERQAWLDIQALLREAR